MQILRICALAVIAAMLAACAATPPAGSSAGSAASPPGPRAYLVFFEPDSAAITPIARDTLGQAVAHLNAAPAARIMVEGHTDLVGTPDYNLALGVRRAAAVQAFLTDAGIVLSRITALSYGLENAPPLEGELRASALLRRVVLRVE
jgi:peptidoglycan-associated lipoprotein